jgi:cardiolipin synthase A/B
MKKSLFRSLSRQPPSRRVALLVAASVVTTLALTLLAMNFASGEKQIERRIARHYSLDDPRFAAELGLLLGPAFVDGNRITELRNGDAIFPAMLAAIRAAKTSITFETYIYWSGEIGQEFAAALAERAQQGVKVHVLLDWVGSAKMDADALERMSAAGVQIRKFHPPHWSNLGRMNNRTHRKVLVADGRVAFTGGVGIAQHWSGNAQGPDHWRDTHFQVEGPVVGQMQAVFMDNWIKVTGQVLHGAAYFAQAPAALGSSSAQMFSSSPAGGSENMQLMYLLAITAATRSIDLSAAYFVPDDLTLNALVAALQRGVKLRIIVPGEHIDSDTVRLASRARWGALLAAGAVIAQYRPTMYHCKIMIVDSLLVSVGSTNFDNRSFRLNDEATLNVIDARFAAQLSASFEADLALSGVVTQEQWQRRPLRERLAERLASLIGSQL